MFVGPYQSKPKGKYGNPANGTVSPGKVKSGERTPPTPGNSELTVASQGIGDSVAHIGYNQTTKTFVATKAVRDSKLIVGEVYGTSLETLAQDYFNVDDLKKSDGTPIRTWSDLREASLPDDFVLGQSVGKQPTGFGYILLTEGSADYGGSSWRAQKTFDELINPEGETTWAYKHAHPVLKYAFVDPDKSLGSVWLVFSSSIDKLLGNFLNDPASYLTLDTDSPQPIKLAKTSFNSSYPNVIELILDRKLFIDDGEQIGIAFGPNTVFDSVSNLSNPAQTRMSPFYRDPRFALLQVVNITGASLSAGSRVAVTHFEPFADRAFGANPVDNGTTISVGVVTEMGGGGGADSMVLSVIGGNVSQITGRSPGDQSDISLDEQGFKDSDYPAQRPYAFPMSLTNRDNDLMVLPSVIDWSRYDLPETWSLGDSTPRLPDGVCYLKLERPYSFGESSWDASMTLGYAQAELPDTEPPVVVKVRLNKDNLSQVTVIFNRPIVKTKSLAKASFGFSSTQKIDGLPGRPVKVTTTPSVQSKKIILQLDRAISPADETVMMTLAANVVTNDARPGVPNVTSVNQVLPSGDKYTVVLAVNRTSWQMYARTDKVLVQDTGITITDSTGASRALLEILGPFGSQMPHAHLTDGGGPSGGGRAAVGLNPYASTIT